MKITYQLIIVAMLFAVGFCLGRCNNETNIEYIETVRIDTVRDTIYPVIPEPKVVYKTRVEYVNVKEFVTDTITINDSVYIEVPISSKTYETQDYKATISGFRPKLDSIEIYQNTIYIDRVREIKDNSRFGVGIQVGYGVSKGGMSPFVGLGVQYNLFKF
jgi:hypothetical protein